MPENKMTLCGSLLAVLLLAPASTALADDARSGHAAEPADAPTPSPAPAQPAAGAPAGVAGDEGAGTVPAADQPVGQQAGAVPSQDANFMMKAANSGYAEVELAKLALERATSEPVKEHARRMLEDHRKANDKLEQIASGKKIPLPDHLTGVHRNLVEKLKSEEAADFDEAYMQAQVGEHKAAVALFRDEKNEGKDPELREFAASELPTLERHLEEALTIAENIVKGGRDQEIPQPQ